MLKFSVKKAFGGRIGLTVSFQSLLRALTAMMHVTVGIGLFA
jgi:hypothetical protein